MVPGRRRRSRSNVWNYAAVKPSGAMDGFQVHTAEPVALVADAITDCTRTGDVVLDTFADLGTTVIGGGAGWPACPWARPGPWWSTSPFGVASVC